MAFYLIYQICLNLFYLKTLKDDKARYKSKLHELDKKLADTNRLVKSKEALIESMENNEKDIEARLQTTQVDSFG